MPAPVAAVVIHGEQQWTHPASSQPVIFGHGENIKD